MSDEIEEVIEETQEVNGIRASLDDVIGETETSDLDDFDPPKNHENPGFSKTPQIKDSWDHAQMIERKWLYR